MRKIIRRTLTALLIVTSLLTAALVGAAVQTFDGKGEWHTSDAETSQMAMNRAEQRAKIDAQKKAGVYLKTYSRSINSELADNAISAVTNNILEVVGEVNYNKKIIPLSDSQTTILYIATLKAKIDTDGIYDWIKRDEKEKAIIIKQNNSLQDAIQKNDKLAERLTEQYNLSTSQVEKDRIRKQMNDADRDFLANQKFEEAIKLYSRADGPRGDSADKVIGLLNESLELNPNHDSVKWELRRAYALRASAYYDQRKYDLAIQDYNKWLELEPVGSTVIYQGRCWAYMKLNQYEMALQDINKAIELKGSFWEFCYDTRGDIYMHFKRYTEAINDYTKYLQNIGGSVGGTYYNRGLCYQAIGDMAKAQADFAKAKELGYNG